MENLKTQSSWFLLPISIGFITIFKLSFSLLKWVFTTFLRPPKNLKKDYGSWALITGSTDGIGKAFAFQLAQKGHNLLLVSRNLERLTAVSGEINAKLPNTQIRILALDFSGDIFAGIRQLEEAIEELDVGMLINNVGITYPAARFFHEVGEEVWMNVVRVNLEGTTRVTRAVLQGMLKRRRGAIVNIGSGAANVVPSHPLYAVYAATKAYVDQLSKCLHVEYKNYGIHVQCQVPLYVATKMVSRMVPVDQSSLFIPSADQYARAAVRRIGYEACCTPFWAHSLQWRFASLFPEAVLDAWRLSIGIHRRNKSFSCEE